MSDEQNLNGAPPAAPAAPQGLQLRFTPAALGVLQVNLGSGPLAVAIALPHASARQVIAAWTAALDQAESSIVLAPAAALPGSRRS